MGELPYVLYDDVEAMKAVDPEILVGVCETCIPSSKPTKLLAPSA
jgi:hypothetical protein